MSKTLGEIARQASDDFEESCDESDFLRMNTLSWEAAANAIIEECAKIADDDDGNFTWAGMDRNVAMLQTCAKEIASAIRALKTPTPGEEK